VYQVFAAAAARAEWAPLLPAIVGDLAEVMICLRQALSDQFHDALRSSQNSRWDVGWRQRRSHV